MTKSFICFDARKPAVRALGARGRRLAALGILAITASACSSASPFDTPRTRVVGTGQLWWLVLVLAVVAYAAVVALLIQWRRAARRGVARDRRSPARTFLIVVLLALPTAALLLTYLYGVRTLDALAAGVDSGNTIEVIGHPWWWEVRYSNGVVTANELHVPVGADVQLQLDTTEAGQALLLPQLMGNSDPFPARTNTIWLHADRPGEYLSQCAAKCGPMDNQMRLLVVAEPAPAYLAWLANEQRPADPPADAQLLAGQQVFLGSACVYCHTVGGTNATGKVGPDLTHLASRRMLGAGIMANVPGNLAGWVVNSQALKPGNRMPPMYIPSNDMQVLLAYLNSLH